MVVVADRVRPRARARSVFPTSSVVVVCRSCLVVGGGDLVVLWVPSRAVLCVQEEEAGGRDIASHREGGGVARG